MTLQTTTQYNQKLLLKFYKTSSLKLKKQIFEALKNGYDATHLRKLQAEVEQEITNLQVKFAKYSKDATFYALQEGIDKQETQYKQLAIPFEPIEASSVSFSKLNKDAISILVENTYKPLSKVSTLIGRDVKNYLKRDNFKDSKSALEAIGKFVDNKVLREAGLDATKGIVLGSNTWKQASEQLEKTLAKQEIFKIPYYSKDGSIKCMVDVADYANMVARTTSAQAFREGSKISILENFNGDLVEITGISSFPDSPCVPFQGKILSLEGKTEGHMLLSDAEAQGLFHPNCIHDFAVTTDVIQEYEDNNIDY